MLELLYRFRPFCLDSCIRFFVYRTVSFPLLVLLTFASIHSLGHGRPRTFLASKLLYLLLFIDPLPTSSIHRSKAISASVTVSLYPVFLVISFKSCCSRFCVRRGTAIFCFWSPKKCLISQLPDSPDFPDSPSSPIRRGSNILRKTDCFYWSFNRLNEICDKLHLSLSKDVATLI